MLPIEIKPDIFWIGINDHTTALFEGLWPISQDGITYNSYLIRDEKKAIIDLANTHFSNTVFDHIRELTDVTQIDYLIINHMEPDHTGAIQALRELAPRLTILGTDKTRNVLQVFNAISENVRTVQDGETLSLGKHTLRFLSTPHIHWPETMMTYEESEQILFSCDGFGGFGAFKGTIFDDEMIDFKYYQSEMLRYFANIMPSFSLPVARALTKLAEIPIAIVAPSHGLIWRRQHQEVINLYKKWAEYHNTGGEIGVTLIYGTEYGNTEKLMDVIAQGVSSEEIPLQVFNVPRTHISYILPALWTQRGVLIGAPTYEGTLFPPMVQTLGVAELKHVAQKTAAYFGSYGWKGGAAKHFERLNESLNWKLAESFVINGAPTSSDLHRALEFGAQFARLIKTEAGA
jgi:anaerobic nitric oxide reductase flavorubredoxin